MCGTCLRPPGSTSLLAAAPVQPGRGVRAAKSRGYAACQACENTGEGFTADTVVQHQMTSWLSADLIHDYILQVPGRGVRYQG